MEYKTYLLCFDCVKITLGKKKKSHDFLCIMVSWISAQIVGHIKSYPYDLTCTFHNQGLYLIERDNATRHDWLITMEGKNLHFML